MKQEKRTWSGVKVGLLFVLTALTMGTSGGCPMKDFWLYWGEVLGIA